MVREKRERFFTGRQVTTMVVAFVVGAVLIPGAAFAVDAFQNVAVEDPVSGAKASVDASHHVLVSDGSGPMTVDGTLSGRPYLPTKPWYFNGNQSSTSSYAYAQVRGPSTVPIALTSIEALNTNRAQTVSLVATFINPQGGGYTAPLAQFGLGQGETKQL